MLLHQHLVIPLFLTDLAIEVQLPRLEAELGQQPIRPKKLLLLLLQAQKFLPPLDQEKLLLPPSLNDDRCIFFLPHQLVVEG